MQDLENEGYEFEAAEASFDLLVKKAAGLYQPWFERLGYRVNIEATPRRHAGHRGDGEGHASASTVEHTVERGRRPGERPGRGAAQGAGAVLSRGSAEMQLVDYKVRVVNARAGTAARVRVVIEMRDDDGRLGHGRRQREHHRGELAGAGRRDRVQAVQGRAKHTA